MAVAFGDAWGRGEDDHFDLLYIDANVGLSSGGHVALRVGNDVFHYQHDPDGFIALARDEWPRFRLIYNDLDNRNIHLARVRLDPRDLRKVRDRFVQRYLIQHGHLAHLASLRRDRALLQQLQAGFISIVPGAAYFGSTRGASHPLQPLKERIAARFGGAFVSRTQSALARQLSSARYRQPDPDRLELTATDYPAYPPTFSDTYLDMQSKSMALQVLAGERAPGDEVFLDSSRYGIAAASLRLKPQERTVLRRLKHKLSESILTLLGAQHGGSGYPLLLALARYQAIEQSLAADRLILIDPYLGLTDNIAYPEDAEQRRALQHLVLRFEASFRETRAAFFGLDDLDEASLNLLETSAARYFEARRGVTRRVPFKLPAGFVLPTAFGQATVARHPIAGGVTAQALGEAEESYRAFRAGLREIYPYDLITKNCATELVRTLNSAFASEHETVGALGGALDPDGLSTRVPFRLYERAAESLRIESQSEYPSYRNRTLARFAAIQDPLWIYLAESNTLTSSFYRRRLGDTHFLLFTEDMTVLRPIYGTVNLVYGLTHAVTGLLTSPVDQGERLSEGLRGAMFSLPELVFFNIRKGSFGSIDRTEARTPGLPRNPRPISRANGLSSIRTFW